LKSMDIIMPPVILCAGAETFLPITGV